MRSKFQGLKNVAVFNWPYYAFSFMWLLACAAFFLFLDSSRFVWQLRVAVGASALVTGYFGLASLVATHIVYDRSDLYSLRWLEKLPGPVRIAASVSAGFDETADLLRRAIPELSLELYDFFDPAENTEASIARARKLKTAEAFAFQKGLRKKYDTIFLILSAHEMRSPPSQIQFFEQLRAGILPGGQIVMLEHLRNLANFLAYGPGFFHFHSDKRWRQSISKAGGVVKMDFAITPFVRLYVIQ